MSSFLGSVTNFVHSINWTSPTWDLFIWIFFIVASFLYGVSLGRDRIIVIMVGLYMALAIVGNTPFLRTITAQVDVQGFGAKFTVFVGSFVIFFFLLSRSALSDALSRANPRNGNWLQVSIYSVLHVGLLISIVLSFLPLTSIALLAPMTQQVFLSDIGRFVWLIAPIVAMIVLQNNRGGGGGRRMGVEDFDE